MSFAAQIRLEELSGDPLAPLDSFAPSEALRYMRNVESKKLTPQQQAIYMVARRLEELYRQVEITRKMPHCVEDMDYVSAALEEPLVNAYQELIYQFPPAEIARMPDNSTRNGIVYDIAHKMFETQEAEMGKYADEYAQHPPQSNVVRGNP